MKHPQNRLFYHAYSFCDNALLCLGVELLLRCRCLCLYGFIMLQWNACSLVKYSYTSISTLGSVQFISVTNCSSAPSSFFLPVSAFSTKCSYYIHYLHHLHFPSSYNIVESKTQFHLLKATAFCTCIMTTIY